MVYRDNVRTTTVIRLSLMDRIRVLFGQPITLRTSYRTENEVGCGEQEPNELWVGKEKPQPSGVQTCGYAPVEPI